MTAMCLVKLHATLACHSSSTKVWPAGLPLLCMPGRLAPAERRLCRVRRSPSSLLIMTVVSGLILPTLSPTTQPSIVWSVDASTPSRTACMKAGLFERPLLTTVSAVLVVIMPSPAASTACSRVGARTMSMK